MFTTEIRQTTEQFEKLREKINKVIKAKPIADIVWRDNVDNFFYGTTPEGAPLKALSSRRIIQKIMRGFPYPKKPMVASTQLAQSLEAFEIDDDNAFVTVLDNRFQTADNPMRTITNKQLLDIHQKTRPTFGIGKKTLDKIREYIMQAIG